MKKIILIILLVGINFSIKAQQDISGELTLTSNLDTEWSKLIFKRNSEPNNGFLQYYGGTDSGIIIGVSGVNPIRFFSNGQEKMRIAKEGDLCLTSLSSAWSKITFNREGELNNGFVQYYGGTDSGMILGVSGINPIRFFSNGQEKMRISKEGNLAIGTIDTKGYKLSIAGKAVAEEVKVALQTSWPDYVFKQGYELPTLNEVENHIKEKGYLIDIPSAKEVQENGILLGEMNSKLLQKIEELTLYTIKQEKKIQNLEKENQEIKLLNKKLLELQSRLEKLESEK
ncbi:hypothetical protein HN014_13300 [Aquimarina sp. TRL1]|uniref:hypothetical protein n=1 Tax=Aquimarina sp. (strain TRL1) TaxID=2736252 RepID=UPI00158A1B8D|nr:hypothetical protein [Aquimarina sp. TRL1]QKX05842.1 hypothetical protein HN014_13300 [Aquimarina sp. TRL1]